MLYEQMLEAVEEAERTLRCADIIATHLAKMLVGRLHKVENSWSGTQVLCRLKRELRAFNMTTKRWKS